MCRLFKNLWSYRGFITSNIQREFQAKYHNSLLGVLWTVIHPAAMVLIYTVIFSQVMRTRLPGVDNSFAYSIYLCAGVLTWNFFSEIVMRSQNVFLEYGNLIKKLNFPHLCLPMIVLGSATLNFLIVFILFLLFLIVSGNFPGLVILSIVPVLLIQVLFALGLGVSLGVLNVFFRDVGQLFGILMQFWFWLTPIVYATDTLPKAAVNWIQLNPMTPLVNAYQEILVRKHLPSISSLYGISLLAILLCGLGFQLFRKHAGEMVDEL